MKPGHFPAVLTSPVPVDDEPNPPEISAAEPAPAISSATAPSARTVEVAAAPARARSTSARKLPRRWRIWLKWSLLIFVGTLLLAATVGYIVLRVAFNGRALAKRIERSINKGIAGRIEIGSVEWEPSAIFAVIADGTAKVTVKNVKVFDPKGDLALEISRVKGRIRPRPLMPWSSSGDLLVAELIVEDAMVNVHAVKPEGSLEHAVGLVDAFRPRILGQPPSEMGTIVSIERAELRRVDLRLNWPKWSARLPAMHGDATLWRSRRDPAHPVFTFDFKPRAGSALITLPAERTIEIEQLVGSKFGRDRDRPHETQFELGATASGSPLTIVGAFLHDPQTTGGVRVDVVVPRSGKLLADLVNDLMPPSARQLLSIQAGGKLTAHIKGPWDDLEVDIDPEDVQLGPEQSTDPEQPQPQPQPQPKPSPKPKRRTQGAAAPRKIDLSQLRVYLRRGHVKIARGVMTVDGIQVELLDGFVRGRARLGLADDSVDATLAVDGVKLDSLMPQALRPTLGGRVSGSLGLRGRVGDGGKQGDAARVEVAGIQLSFTRSGSTKTLPHRITMRGDLTIEPTEVSVQRLAFTGSGLDLQVRGDVRLASQKLALSFTAEHTRLGPLITKDKLLQDLLRGVKAKGDISGAFADPRVHATVTTRGGKSAGLDWPRLLADLRWQAGRVSVDLAEVKAFGGKLAGAAKVTLPAGRRAGKIDDAHLRLTGIEMARLAPLGGNVRGVLDVTMTAEGSLLAPSAQGHAVIQGLRAGGIPLKTARATARLRGGALDLDATLTPRAGGMLSVKGTVAPDGDLSLSVQSPVKLPLAAIPQLERAGLTERGLISVALSLVGNLRAPLLLGEVSLDGMRVDGQEIGGSRLWFSAGDSDGDGRPDGGQRLGGRLAGEQIELDGPFQLRPLDAQLALRAPHLVVERLWPRLEDLGAGAKANARVDLLYGPSARALMPPAQKRAPPVSPLAVTLTLTSAELRIRQLRKSSRGLAPESIVFTTRDAVLEYAGGVLTTPKAITLRDARKDSRFDVSAKVSPNALSVSARGTLEMPLIQLYLPTLTQSADGQAYVDITASGTPARPELTGSISFESASIVPRGVDNTRVRVNSGKLRLEKSELHVERLVLEVVSEDAKPESKPCTTSDVIRRCLFLNGHVMLNGLAPKNLDLTLGGVAGARLLPAFLPRTFADAQGAASIDLTITGNPADPALAGELRFDRGRVELAPRRLGKDLVIERGALTFVPPGEGVARLEVGLEGRLDYSRFGVRGWIDHVAFEPIDVQFQDIWVNGFTYRSPGVFEVEADVDLDITGDKNSLTVKGDVSIVDGRYVQPLSIAEAIFLPRKTSEQSPPFWKGSPWLERTNLVLRISTTGDMVVKNNLAELSLFGRISVTGQLNDPRVDGIVRVEEGEFHIPFLRGNFTVVTGTIYFDKDERPPYDTPNIDIVAETLFEDRTVPELDAEREHNIRLTLQGPLADIQFDLTSDTGLAKAEVLSLLTIGRTTSALRTQARGDATVSAYSSGSRNDNVLTAGDQFLKDITEGVLGQLEDPLKRLTSLDVVKLRLSTTCLEVEAAERFGRYVRMGLVYDCTIGQERTELYGTARVHENASFEVRARRLLSETAAQLDDDEGWRTRTQLKFRWKVP